MYINTEKKYSPKTLKEFIFPSESAKSVILAHASGEVECPLILHGESGTGKSLLQKLIPNAIEGCSAIVNQVKCADIKSASDIHNLYGRNKQFQRTFSVNNQKYNYYIFEEFLITNKRISDALKMELDATLGIDMTIISTNRYASIDGGIVSRSDELELCACDALTFFPHAKKIVEGEGIEISDDELLARLHTTYVLYKDNRKYYRALDKLISERTQSHSTSFAQ